MKSPKPSRSKHGKPLAQARLEVIRGCEFFEWDAGEAQRLYGRVIPSGPGIRYIVLRQPVGTVAAFSPWNFPMSQPARKVGRCAGGGLFDHPQGGRGDPPAGALHIARAFHEAGLPPGVLNLIFGEPAEISSYLIPQDEIRLVAFNRLDSGRPASERNCGQSHNPGANGAGRACAGHRLPRMADPVASGALSAVRKIRNAGPGLYRTDAFLRA